jgi:hypothetical protein
MANAPFGWSRYCKRGTVVDVSGDRTHPSNHGLFKDCTVPPRCGTGAGTTLPGQGSPCKTRPGRSCLTHNLIPVLTPNPIHC